MTTYVFVPLSDDMIFNHPEKIRGPLVAFNPDCIISNPASTKSDKNSISDKKAQHRDLSKRKGDASI
jgi:hypothetical protein